MHKPVQVELQLDRPQLPYSETLGSIIAGGSPAHYRRRQSNPTRKGPYRRKKRKKEKEKKKDEHNSLVVDRSCTTHCSRVDIYLMPYTICLKFKLYISIHEGFDWLKMSDYPSKVLEISMGTQC